MGDFIMKNPKISVIMSVYNEKPEILQKAIDSILNQTFADFEFLILLDNPQNEENFKILNNYAKNDSRIILKKNEKNIGLCACLNKMLKMAKGDFIARMDADDISFSTRFEEQLEFLEKNNLDFVGSYAQTIDDFGKIIMNCVKVPVTHKKIVKTLQFNSCIFHPTWFVKKEVFNTVGFYQGEYIEDYDFILRCVKAGFKFGNVPKVLFQYRLSSQSISRDNLFKQYLFMRFIQKKYFKNYKKSEKFYIEKHFSKKAAVKYAKSANFFTNALSNLKNKQFLAFFINMLKAFFTSFHYAEKIFRYILQYLA